jgi:3-oxoisoapionate decarboxylase
VRGSPTRWLLDQVDHPSVGACLDTMNAGPLLEDVMQAIAVIAPRAFTNHFRDERVTLGSTGYRLCGGPVGQGDLDVRRAYELIRDPSPCDCIIIENAPDIPFDTGNGRWRCRRRRWSRACGIAARFWASAATTPATSMSRGRRWR